MRYYKIILKNKHADIKARLVTYLKTSKGKNAEWAAEYIKNTGAFGSWDVLKVIKVTKEEALENE